MILSVRAKKCGSRDRDSGCPKQGVLLSNFNCSLKINCRKELKAMPSVIEDRGAV